MSLVRSSGYDDDFDSKEDFMNEAPALNNMVLCKHDVTQK